MREEGYGHILFELGSWEIHALFEDSDWVEIFHHCKKYNPIEDRVKYSYQLPNDVHCPGCNEIQPDAIQALEQMHNMDRPARQYGMSLIEKIKRDMVLAIRKQEEMLCLTGNGVND